MSTALPDDPEFDVDVEPPAEGDAKPTFDDPVAAASEDDDPVEPDDDPDDEED